MRDELLNTTHKEVNEKNEKENLRDFTIYYAFICNSLVELLLVRSLLRVTSFCPIDRPSLIQHHWPSPVSFHYSR